MGLTGLIVYIKLMYVPEPLQKLLCDRIKSNAHENVSPCQWCCQSCDEWWWCTYAERCSVRANGFVSYQCMYVRTYVHIYVRTCVRTVSSDTAVCV